MSSGATDTGEDRGWRRFIAPLVFGLVLAGLAFGVWRLSQNDAGARKEAPKVDIVSLTPPPPPPPPPPPKEQPPEPTPDKVVEAPTPTPTPQAPQQLTIAGPPQAGGDAFGLQAGSGQGMVGAGGSATGGPGGSPFATGSYGRYLSGALQEAVQADKRINRLVFSVDVALWVGPDGRITRASILRSSGNARTDEALLSALQAVGRLDEAPPPNFRFPQRITVRGRKA